MSVSSIHIRPGETVEKVLPHSEVCMHFNLAGKKMKVKLLETGRMCQLFSLDGRPFSFPITAGEAGIYSEGDVYYYFSELG